MRRTIANSNLKKEISETFLNSFFIFAEIFLENGFDLFGVAPSNDSSLTEALKVYKNWIDSKKNAEMQYLSRHLEIKSNPDLFLKNVKSVLCVGLLYGDSQKFENENTHQAKVSSYARGPDYHKVMRDKLEHISYELKKRYEGDYKIFVDSEPVLDRYWGWRSGLGWIGKNSCLINRKIGSLFFIGGIFTTLDLESSEVHLDHCGKCTKCIDACPTKAILNNRTIDSNLCIGYHTIENKGVVPEVLYKNFNQWVAGCDICQTVCPWNDPVTTSKQFQTHHKAYKNENNERLPILDLIRWTQDDFQNELGESALSRMGYIGWLRNLTIALISSNNFSSQEVESALIFLKQKANQTKSEKRREGLLKAIEVLSSHMLKK